MVSGCLGMAAARNPGIDSVRGLSIVLVVMHHLAIRIPLSHTALAAVAPDWLLGALCWNGYESVLVFFVVSGFLITGNALDRWKRLGHPEFRTFYVRRAARILPCLLFLVAVLSVLDLLRVPDYTITRPDQSLGGAVFAALSFHLNWYEAFSGYLPGNWDVLWSLSVEEIFYLGFPVACLLARRGLAPFLVLFCLLALSLPISHGAIRGNELLQEKAYLPGMAAIAAGVLAAVTSRQWRLSRRTGTVLIVLGSFAWCCVLVEEDALWQYMKDATLLVLTAGIAVLMMGLRTLAGTPLPVTGWLRAFGRLSYEVYLTHMFVVFGVLQLAREWGLPDRQGYVLYPAVLCISLWLGWCLARFLSRPADFWIRAMS